MFEAETTAFLHSGCALIVGTVDPDGAPHAGRAWGLDILPGDDVVVRLLLDVDDPVTIEHAAAGGAMAITATSVPTLRSLQLKGRSLGMEVADPEHAARADRYADEFFGDITATDHTPRALCEVMRPAGVVACTVEIHELFDQTPGPTAGAEITRRPP